MKKLMVVILSFIVLCSMSLTVFAQTENSETILLSGIEMSLDDFKETYITEEEVHISSSDYNLCYLELSNVIIGEESVDMSADLYTDSTDSSKFQISGEIYSSFKKQLFDVNDIIIDAKTDNEDISIMLFNMIFRDDNNLSETTTDVNGEIKADDGFESFFLVNQLLAENSALRLYIVMDNRIYLFENELPSVFEWCNNDYTFLSDPTKDMIWYSSLVEPIVTSIDADSLEGKAIINDILPEATVYSDPVATYWQSDTIYSTEFTIAGTQVSQVSRPFGYYTIRNVEDQIDWIGEFYISESTTYLGETVDYMDNTISYRDVLIGIACGNGTQVNKVKMNGRVYSISDASDIRNGVLDILSSSLQWWSVGQSITDVFMECIDTGEDLVLGESMEEAFGNKTTGGELLVPEDAYRLFRCSYDGSKPNFATTDSPAHYLIFTGTVSTTDDSAVVTTTGSMNFQWDVYFSSSYSPIYDDECKVVQKTYVAGQS